MGQPLCSVNMSLHPHYIVLKNKCSIFNCCISVLEINDLRKSNIENLFNSMTVLQFFNLFASFLIIAHEYTMLMQ